MSKNQHLPLAGSNKKTDARVRRTRDALGDALVALMQEKPFETITVQDVLDRAQVSRSTFYSHCRDKADRLTRATAALPATLSMAPMEQADISGRVWRVQ